MRKENWPSILVAAIDEQKSEKFEWGKSDCLQFASRVAAQLIDHDILSEADNRYTDETGAYALLSEMGGYDGVFGKYFKQREAPRFACRGDIVTVSFNDQNICGIVDASGRMVACKGERGVFYLPFKYITRAWEVR